MGNQIHQKGQGDCSHRRPTYRCLLPNDEVDAKCILGNVVNMEEHTPTSRKPLPKYVGKDAIGRSQVQKNLYKIVDVAENQLDKTR